ncbi:hypothetical protein LINPERHAP1_LOCUS14306 [Linum perenne]
MDIMLSNEEAVTYVAGSLEASELETGKFDNYEFELDVEIGEIEFRDGETITPVESQSVIDFLKAGSQFVAEIFESIHNDEVEFGRFQAEVGISNVDLETGHTSAKQGALRIPRSQRTRASPPPRLMGSFVRHLVEDCRFPVHRILLYPLIYAGLKLCIPGAMFSAIGSSDSVVGGCRADSPDKVIESISLVSNLQYLFSSPVDLEPKHLDGLIIEFQVEDGNVRLFFHGVHDREYQVPVTTTIIEVKKMIQPNALVSNAKLNTQILLLQLSEESKTMTLMKDEDRTLESYGLLNNALAREVSIKYCGEGSFIYLRFDKPLGTDTHPIIRVKFSPEKETVGGFRKRMIKELMKQENTRIQSGGSYIVLKGPHAGRRSVPMRNYSPRASFARTLLNDVFGRWTRTYRAKVICFPLYDPKSSDKQISRLFDRMSV